MDLTPYISLLPAHYAALALALVGLCAAVSAFLPPPTQAGTLYATVYHVMNLIGANRGHATNATDPGVTGNPPPAATGDKSSPVTGLVLALLLFGGAGALTACGVALTPASVAQDVVLIDDGLQSVLAHAGMTLPPAVTTALADIDVVAKALADAENLSAAQPMVQRVAADVLVIASAATADNLAPAGSDVARAIQAAQVLIPAVETAAGIVAPASASASGGMTVSTARLALAAYAKQP